MRVLIAHNFYQQAGGEDESFKAEAAALREAGHEVAEYAVHNDSIKGMSKLGVAVRTLWNRQSYRELRSLIRQHRPEVVHFNNTFPLISPAGYYAARAEGVPVVQSLRNYRLLCPGALFYHDGKVCEECLHKPVLLTAVKHACYRGSRSATATVAAMITAHRAVGTWDRAVDLYVALTEFARRKFIEGGFRPDRVVVKPNFVHPDPGVGTGRGGYAVFLGRLSPEKGIGAMLGAWERHNLGQTLPLKIIGGGPLGAEVAAAAERIPGVQFLGKMPPRQAYEIVGEAAMLILPSQWYETFGRVAVEAFAKGTPVVASDLGAMAELVEGGRTGLLFKPGDSDDLARQIRQLHGQLADPATRDRLRAACRSEYEQKYTASQNVRRMVEIYQTAIATARGTTPPAPAPTDSTAPAPRNHALPQLPPAAPSTTR